MGASLEFHQCVWRTQSHKLQPSHKGYWQSQFLTSVLKNHGSWVEKILDHSINVQWYWAAEKNSRCPPEWPGKTLDSPYPSPPSCSSPLHLEVILEASFPYSPRLICHQILSLLSLKNIWKCLTSICYLSASHLHSSPWPCTTATTQLASPFRSCTSKVPSSHRK